MTIINQSFKGITSAGSHRGKWGKFFLKKVGMLTISNEYLMAQNKK